MIIKEANRLGSIQEYYFSRKNAEIAEMNRTGIPVINLGIGSPDLRPSDETVDKLYEIALRDDSHGYQPYRGDLELRRAVSAWYEKTFGVKSDPNSEVLPLAGSKEGIMHITMSFVNEGDEVLVPDPGYPTYASVTLLAGAKIRNYRLKEEAGWQIDFDELEKQDLSKVKLMWSCFPNMPTGVRATDETYRRLIALAKKNGFLLVNDNPYSLVLNDEYKSVLTYEGAKEVALEMNSLSKSHNMAGWRVGWVIGEKDYIDAIMKFKSNMDSGIFLGIQRAAVKALENSDEWHIKRNEEYRERRKLAEELAAKLGLTFDKNQVGLFLWCKIPASMPSGEWLSNKVLKEARVFITPSFIFGSTGERFVRISLCTKQKNFREAIERISKLDIAKL
ncbi:MAG: aminotransferase class I/II-fold pyridoxal phosphate-dependent enzyme [Prevotellaceae bacterium]|jgi:aspartate/methionine/tyrosine aminotransferase|nr:aminotransferase class I/II-fold pyridoxal phosphate-dependent enzyme [Prevotellaceae bacterium]